MMRWSILAFIALTACTTASEAPQAVSAPPPAQTPVERGRAFAEARCSACHAVTAQGISPNPESPPFAAVVNKPGITRDTLGQFLRDSHNFPGAMNFRVEPEQIDDLTEYMLTLQAPGYRPPI